MRYAAVDQLAPGVVRVITVGSCARCGDYLITVERIIRKEQDRALAVARDAAQSHYFAKPERVCNRTRCRAMVDA